MCKNYSELHHGWVGLHAVALQWHSWRAGRLQIAVMLPGRSNLSLGEHFKQEPEGGQHSRIDFQVLH
jgi:hypothetical protein